MAAMVQAQNARNMGGKFPKKRRNSQPFLQNAISPRKMTQEGSTRAQNEPKNVLYLLEAQSGYCDWKCLIAKITVFSHMLFAKLSLSYAFEWNSG
jgi:hypothetical protein